MVVSGAGRALLYVFLWFVYSFDGFLFIGAEDVYLVNGGQVVAPSCFLLACPIQGALGDVGAFTCCEGVVLGFQSVEIRDGLGVMVMFFRFIRLFGRQDQVL